MVEPPDQKRPLTMFQAARIVSGMRNPGCWKKCRSSRVSNAWIRWGEISSTRMISRFWSRKNSVIRRPWRSSILVGSAGRSRSYTSRLRMLPVAAMATPQAAPTTSATSRQTATCTRVNEDPVNPRICVPGVSPAPAGAQSGNAGAKKENGRPPRWGTDLPFQVPAQNEVNWEGN